LRVAELEIPYHPTSWSFYHSYDWLVEFLDKENKNTARERVIFKGKLPGRTLRRSSS
jgi:hypothetical protein